MVHKHKARLETDHIGAQSSSRGLQNISSGSSNTYTTRPVKQFSTKSKAKNAASFKGLHKGVAHDGASEVDTHHLGESSFRKSRSSDSLYRKRVISGLNMTALTRVKSNPSQITCSRSSSVNSSTGNTLENVTTGLKPSTSKSTHSVLELHGGDQEIDDDTTTDEEVEYFSDEEENENDNDNVRMRESPPTAENSGSQNVSNRIRRTSEETKMLSKSFDRLTLPYKGVAEEKAPPLLNQPSYKPPSSLIHPQREKPLLAGNPDNEISGKDTDSKKGESEVVGTAAKMQSEELRKQKANVAGDYKILHDEGDDHIDNNHLYNVDADTSMEASAHSLKRQGKNFQKANEGHLPLTGRNESSSTKDNYIRRHENEDHEQYVPNMILSQSMGVERRFDQPASIQNSLADNYGVTSPRKESQNDYNTGLDKENQVVNSSSFQYTNKDQLRDQRQEQRGQEQQEEEKRNVLQQQQHEQQDQKKLERKFHLLQRSQLSPQDNQLQQRQQQNNSAKHNIQNNFPTSVSSLTTSLQKMAPENVYNISRKSPFLRKKPSQLSFLGSNPRGHSSDITNSYLHRETPSPSSDINNFTQFLKSDAMDGESRTQRKLWLQRENSILDLTSQHDSCDSIFLAGDIGVKREFERISHEYTNVRRFSNPIEEALTRVNYEQENMGIKNTDCNDLELVDSLIPKLFNGSKEIDEIFPKPESAKLDKLLQSIWREESALFNKDSNPVTRNKSPTLGQTTINTSRTSLKNIMSSGSAIQHQRIINSLQPTTRAVNRRMENALHHQQRP